MAGQRASRVADPTARLIGEPANRPPTSGAPLRRAWTLPGRRGIPVRWWPWSAPALVTCAIRHAAGTGGRRRHHHGCGDACPVYPGKRYLNWELDDPAGQGCRGSGYAKADRRVTAYYFYLVDEAFGPAFVKVCTYFPYPIKIWLNGHEYAKRATTAAGIAFTELDNGFAAADDPAGLQHICEGLGPGVIRMFCERWWARLPLPLTEADRAAGYWWDIAMRQGRSEGPSPAVRRPSGHGPGRRPVRLLAHRRRVHQPEPSRPGGHPARRAVLDGPDEL